MSEPAPRKSSLFVRFLRLFSDLISPTNLAILAGLIVIAGAAAAGGLKAASATNVEIPLLQPGESAAVGSFSISASEAFWTSDVTPIVAGWGDSTFLVVLSEVENTGSTWISTAELQSSITARIPGEEVPPQSGLWSNAYATDGSLGSPTVFRAIDYQSSRTLQPHLAQGYWLVWELPPDTNRASEIELQYYNHTWRRSSLDGSYRWADPVLAYTQILSSPDSGRVN